MTVEANTAEYVDDGDGVTTVFPFPSRFMSNDDITVALDGVVVTTGFSITGAGNPSGGNITFGVAPADGVKVARLRDPAIRQLVDFAGVSGVRPTTMGDIADRQTMVDMALARRQERTLRVSDFEASPPDLTLPAAEDRPNTVVGFDEDGDLVLLPQTEGNVGAPAILELGTGALPLSAFITSATTNHAAALQDAFDEASSTNRPIFGTYLEGGYVIEEDITVRSNTRMWCLPGVKFWNAVDHTYAGTVDAVAYTHLPVTIAGIFKSVDYEAGDTVISNVAFYNLDIEDVDANTAGSHFQMKVDNLKMINWRSVKKGPGWCNALMGDNHTYRGLDIDTSAVDWGTNHTPPPTWQVWSDCIHFSLVNNLSLTDSKFNGQDDCIAFTLDGVDWTTMLPLREKISRKIRINNVTTRSKIAHAIRIGAGAISAPTLNDTVPLDVAYDDITVDGLVHYAPVNAESLGPIVILDDARNAATARHGLITLRNITGSNEVADGVSFFNVFGYDTARDTTRRNFERVVCSDWTVNSSAAGRGRQAEVRGVVSLEMTNFSSDHAAPTAGAQDNFSFYINECDFIRVNDSFFRGSAPGAGAFAALNYTKFEAFNTIFSGNPLRSATVTISNASPGVITWTGHGLVAGDLFTLATNGTLPTGFSPATYYYVKTVLSANTFTASATSGGTVIDTSSAGSGTHTITATEETHALYLTGVSGARLRLANCEFISAASAVSLSGTHSVYKASGLQQTSITNTALPAALLLAHNQSGGDWAVAVVSISGGVASVAFSNNVASVSRTGDGVVEVNLISAASSATYPVNVTVGGSTHLFARVSGRTTTKVTVSFADAAGTPTDPGEFDLRVWQQL